MANFYTDNEDIKFHLGHPLMEKIVALKERNFTEAEQYDNAPRDFEDAIDYLCGKRRDVLCVQILTRDEVNPKIRGKSHLFDSENLKKTYRRNIDKEIIRAYKMAVEYVVSRIRDYCEARGASYLFALADVSVGEIFLGRLADTGVVK